MDNKKILEIMTTISKRELIKELNDSRFNKIRSENPEDWDYLNNLYISETESLRNLFLTTVTEFANEREELLKQLDELKDQYQDEIKKNEQLIKNLEFKSQGKNPLRSSLVILVMFVISLSITFFLLAHYDKESFQVMIEGLLKTLDRLASLFKIFGFKS